MKVFATGFILLVLVACTLGDVQPARPLQENAYSIQENTYPIQGNAHPQQENVYISGWWCSYQAQYGRYHVLSSHRTAGRS